jgi:hypothetical protein
MEFFFKTGTSYLKISVSWDNAAESRKRLPTCGGTYCLHFQGREVSPLWKRQYGYRKRTPRLGVLREPVGIRGTVKKNLWPLKE